MKNFIALLLLYGLAFQQARGQSGIEELRLKIQEIAELKKTNSSLQRQNNELQTRITLLISQQCPPCQLPHNSTTICPPAPVCPPITETIEYKNLKEALGGSVKSLDSLRSVIKTKEDALADAVLKNKNLEKNVTELKQEVKDLKDANAAKTQELDSTNNSLKTWKNKFADLEQASQEMEKAMAKLKAAYQVDHDSLYLSIDFPNKGTIHLDGRAAGTKEPRVGDNILLEIPYNTILTNGANWKANNVEHKMQQIAGLYIRYRDRLRIKLIEVEIEDATQVAEASAVFTRTMGRMNTYAQPFMKAANDTTPLTTPVDFEIKQQSNGKPKYIQIMLVKR